jgi:ADP-heptose:LPS heptosyltransferase
MWPAEAFAALVVALRRRTDLPVLLVGGDADRGAVAAVQGLLETPAPEAVGNMDLAEVAGLLAEAAVFIGADSGLVHLAAAQGCQVVALYGPTDPAAWAPTNPRLRVVRSPVACSPCLYQRGRPPLQIGCAAPFCMDAIHPAAVTEEAIAALSAA